MPILALIPDFEFPPATAADEDGLLVIGGTLSPSKILQAYRLGIFPWYNEDEPVLWWSPDPRFVLFPIELHVSKSMKKIFRQQRFHFTMDRAFEEVIHHCQTTVRKGQHGTWITPEMKAAYVDLHHQGFAHSGEVWEGNKMVGGIYGVQIGNVFFAESMFSTVDNASKFSLISMVNELKTSGVVLIDCQVYSPHVHTLGARLIPRKDFLQLLEKNIKT